MAKSFNKIKSLEGRIGVANGTFGFILSTILVKIIGVIYKIPLYRLLGVEGVGLYQMVFPVYALLLTFAGGGVSTAITRLVANGYNAEDLLKKCLLIFASIGLLFSICLAVFSKQIAILQGNQFASKLYLVISPSVFFVSVIGCVRGYFQGKNSFTPTAFSQVIEQIVKAASALIALLIVDADVLKKGLIACVAITFSEVVALFYLLLKFKKVKNVYRKSDQPQQLIGYAYAIKFIMPITLSAIILPIASFLDSFIAVNALKQIFFEKATSLYGIYTGGVDVVIGLPVGLLHCLILGYLPRISLNKKGMQISIFIIAISAICSVAVLVGAPIVSKFLFNNGEYTAILTTLLRYSSFCIILRGGLQVSNFLLMSANKQKISLINLSIGVIFKLLLNLTLIKIPKINIFGMLISDVACYFVALILNLVYIYYILKCKTEGNPNENNLSGIGRRSKFTIRKSI